MVRKNLPPLKGSYANAFDGPIRLRTYKKGDKIYRSPNLVNNTLEKADSPGPWFGTRATKTKIGAESQAYVKRWDNPLEKLRTYVFTENVTVYYGKVANGKGYQVLIPRDLKAGSVLKHIDSWDLR